MTSKAEKKVLKAEEKADAAEAKAAKAEAKVTKTVAESVYEGALALVARNEKIAISSADKKAGLDALARAEAALKAEKEAEALALKNK